MISFMGHRVSKGGFPKERSCEFHEQKMSNVASQYLAEEDSSPSSGLECYCKRYRSTWGLSLSLENHIVLPLERVDS